MNKSKVFSVLKRKLNRRQDQVRTYGRNEDHIHMVRVYNDFEENGDFVSDNMKTQMLLFINSYGQTIMDDYYYFNFTKPKYLRDCDFCYDELDSHDNRFNDFIRNFDIVNHTNHFDFVFDPKTYNYDHDVKPCWCNNMPQFSRSSVGGSKYLLSAQPYALDPDDLIFESRFESGNLARVIKVTQNYYELYLRPDMYTNRHTQWFYFRVKNTRKNVQYR